MFHQPRHDPNRIEIRSLSDLKSVLDSLGFREEFELELVSTYPRVGWNRPGNIVWYEGTIESGQQSFQFFFDDGEEVQVDDEGEVIDETNEYPYIVCSLNDIIAITRVKRSVD